MVSEANMIDFLYAKTDLMVDLDVYIEDHCGKIVFTKINVVDTILNKNCLILR
jgi:hypothetical protein